MSIFDNYAVYTFHCKYYFSIAYCFFIIEEDLAPKGSYVINQKKSDFRDYAKKYYEEHDMLYEDEYVDNLFRENVSKVLGEYLLDIFSHHREDSGFQNLLSYTLDLIKKAQAEP